MSDSHRKLPNSLLRHEREIRCWTQSYVAERVDTNPFTISRWEKGMTFPSPKHRLKLCKLFGKSAAELGLLPPATDKVQHVTPLADENISPSTLYDSAIPHILHLLVGRKDMLATLKHFLLDKSHTTTVAIKGLSGVGKTALAIALVHDAEVRTQFPDGILWAGLGPQPNICDVLRHWGKLLGLSFAYMQQFLTREALQKAIHSTIGTRRMLLVIDDAWTVEDKMAFQIGGPNCTYLITTQHANVALQDVDKTMTIHELSEDEGVALFTQLAPASKSMKKDVRLLVRAVGGLPLAITLMSRYIHAETFNKHNKRRLLHAFERLRSVEERLSLTQPLDPTEGIASLPDSTTFSLQTMLALREQRLSPETRSALRVLAAFPPKPNTFREEDALAIVTPKSLDELTDASLLESLGEGNYTLHPIIANYAKTVGYE